MCELLRPLDCSVDTHYLHSPLFTNFTWSRLVSVWKQTHLSSLLPRRDLIAYLQPKRLSKLEKFLSEIYGNEAALSRDALSPELPQSTADCVQTRDAKQPQTSARGGHARRESHGYVDGDKLARWLQLHAAWWATQSVLTHTNSSSSLFFFRCKRQKTEGWRYTGRAYGKSNFSFRTITGRFVLRTQKNNKFQRWPDGFHYSWLIGSREGVTLWTEETQCTWRIM